MKHYLPLISLNSKLHDALHRLVVSELAREGLDGLEPCHGDVLTALFREDGLTVGCIARRTRRTKSTVSVLVARLHRMGYVEKQGAPGDARIVRVMLTEKGRALQGAFERISERALAALTAGFSEEETAAFETLLRKACGNFPGAPPAGGS